MAQVFRRVSHMRPVMAVTILAAIGWGTYAQEDDRATRSVAEGPPRIVATTPAAGATDVDPTTSEIVVTFDRDMGGGFSWTGGGPDYPPIAEEQKPHWRDKRTAVLPVKLEAAHYYRVGINSKSLSLPKTPSVLKLNIPNRLGSTLQAGPRRPPLHQGQEPIASSSKLPRGDYQGLHGRGGAGIVLLKTAEGAPEVSVMKSC